MAKTVKVKSTLEEAASVKTVWESNPDFKLGKAGLKDFTAVYTAVKELDDDYAKKDVELSGALSKREEKAGSYTLLTLGYREGCPVLRGRASRSRRCSITSRKSIRSTSFLRIFQR